jgi:hypothetical protein
MSRRDPDVRTVSTSHIDEARRPRAQLAAGF